MFSKETRLKLKIGKQQSASKNNARFTLFKNRSLIFFFLLFSDVNDKSLDNFGLIRTLLLEGLRFHPSSIELNREYFLLELEFLRHITQNPDSFEDTEDRKIEILDGKIVQTVFENILDKVQEPLFICELLSLTLKSKFYKIQDKLAGILTQKFQKVAWSWAVLATLKLYPDSEANSTWTKEDKVEECAKVLLQALETVQNPEMLSESLKIMRQVAENQPELTECVENQIFELLQQGKKLEICSEDHLTLIKEFEELN